jgi:O-antigen/teichoic acid export membrane protein
MIAIYKKATQFMSIFVFSVVGIVAFFSYELLYAWTGNKELSSWGSNILFWYVLGNGILAVGAFQYYLQFAHGKLNMHVKYNTIFPLISIPAIYFAAYDYGAIGVALVWFGFRLLSFLIWVPVIHHKFAPGIHKNWMLQDVIPMFISTTIFLAIVYIINIDLDIARVWIFVNLLILGMLLLLTNSLVSNEGRKIIVDFVKRKKN